MEGPAGPLIIPHRALDAWFQVPPGNWQKPPPAAQAWHPLHRRPGNLIGQRMVPARCVLGHLHLGVPMVRRRDRLGGLWRNRYWCRFGGAFQ